MANPKIPHGYQGSFFESDGQSTLVMVSRKESIADDGKKHKERGTMSEQQRFVPYTTEQKKEYAKQFTPNEIKSYRKGQQSAYAHMGNIGKRNSFFIHDNLKRDEAAKSAPSANKPKSTRRTAGNKSK